MILAPFGKNIQVANKILIVDSKPDPRSIGLSHHYSLTAIIFAGSGTLPLTGAPSPPLVVAYNILSNPFDRAKRTAVQPIASVEFAAPATVVLLLSEFTRI